MIKRCACGKKVEVAEMGRRFLGLARIFGRAGYQRTSFVDQELTISLLLLSGQQLLSLSHLLCFSIHLPPMPLTRQPASRFFAAFYRWSIHSRKCCYALQEQYLTCTRQDPKMLCNISPQP